MNVSNTKLPNTITGGLLRGTLHSSEHVTLETCLSVCKTRLNVALGLLSIGLFGDGLIKGYKDRANAYCIGISHTGCERCNVVVIVAVLSIYECGCMNFPASAFATHSVRNTYTTFSYMCSEIFLMSIFLWKHDQEAPTVLSEKFPGPCVHMRVLAYPAPLIL